uniref:Uncharacterized protein n=1 Tax=Moniliophthora roreri TaxID=221103 RepID=A0A0W0GB44_MONRR
MKQGNAKSGVLTGDDLGQAGSAAKSDHVSMQSFPLKSDDRCHSYPLPITTPSTSFRSLNMFKSCPSFEISGSVLNNVSGNQYSFSYNKTYNSCKTANQGSYIITNNGVNPLKGEVQNTYRPSAQIPSHGPSDNINDSPTNHTPDTYRTNNSGDHSITMNGVQMYFDHSSQSADFQQGPSQSCDTPPSHGHPRSESRTRHLAPEERSAALPDLQEQEQYGMTSPMTMELNDIGQTGGQHAQRTPSPHREICTCTFACTCSTLWLCNVMCSSTSGYTVVEVLRLRIVFSNRMFSGQTPFLEIYQPGRFLGIICHRLRVMSLHGGLEREHFGRRLHIPVSSSEGSCAEVYQYQCRKKPFRGSWNHDCAQLLTRLPHAPGDVASLAIDTHIFLPNSLNT